jgi:hypothetical protein
MTAKRMVKKGVVVIARLHHSSTGHTGRPRQRNLVTDAAAKSLRSLLPQCLGRKGVTLMPVL